jgi:NNP family nitrate/nitrite transporter-like MFS transporter
LVVAGREGAAVIGLASAFGALGGFFIPRAFGASLKATNGLTTALTWFVLFYLTCIGLTFWYYLRPHLKEGVRAFDLPPPVEPVEAVPSASP